MHGNYHLRNVSGVAGAVGICLLAAACGNSDQGVDSALKEVRQWRDEADLRTLKGRLERLERNDLQRTLRENAVAHLDPTDNSFAFLSTEAGPLAISVEKVEPVAGGSRALLKIGNTTAATISRMKFTVEWGPLDKDGNADESKVRSSERSIQHPLAPGIWTNMVVPLTGTPPLEVGHLRVSKPNIENISLHRETT